MGQREERGGEYPVLVRICQFLEHLRTLYICIMLSTALFVKTHYMQRKKRRRCYASCLNSY